MEKQGKTLEDEIRDLRAQYNALGGDPDFMDGLPKALGAKNKEEELNCEKHFLETYIELYKS
jgi:hypothetical protein